MLQRVGVGGRSSVFDFDYINLLFARHDRQQLQFAGQELRVAGQELENVGQGIRFSGSVILRRSSFFRDGVRRRRDVGVVNRNTEFTGPNDLRWLAKIQGQQESK